MEDRVLRQSESLARLPDFRLITLREGASEQTGAASVSYVTIGRPRFNRWVPPGATKSSGLPLPYLALPCCGRNELLLRAVHFRSISGILVVKPLQMEKPMCDVQTQLTLNRIPKSPRLTPRCLDADENLPMLKCDHVRRAGKMEEPAMQFRHAPVRNQDHVQLGDALQAPALLLSLNLKALHERVVCEFLQRRKRDAHCALPIMH